MTAPILTLQRWDGKPTDDTQQFGSMVEALTFATSTCFPHDVPYPRHLLFGNEVAFYFDEITEVRCCYLGFGAQSWDFWLNEAARYD